jgi:hypothetical protein
MPRPVPPELIDDDEFHCCTRIGRSHLLCGRKNSRFPYTMFVSLVPTFEMQRPRLLTYLHFHSQVGPDWYCVIVTYSLIIVPSVLFINNIAYQWGPSVIVITVFLMTLTLGYDDA